ncbi:hypothetical protein PRIPAC_90975 [Pristionchus pacificus]|uniref:Uncharacterized protein n=1 Tax=Pristionchus pacificus TaxID=54126 RepID=A0A2A6CYM0_PRIPA|nr:hypothetical protein PRIPAC_90975 [Pristionchus pacificus]|eukprot:PDM83121.1 hypothetical protein PRIPAC_37514 [Pristionchus pacificus]
MYFLPGSISRDPAIEPILRLLLIFSLSSIGSSFKTEIDLNRCKTETACFIRKSCLVDKTATPSEIEAAKSSLVRYRNEPLNDNTCDVILQARSFTSYKLHIMMQVNSSDPSVPATDVKLQQNGVQFRCSNGRATTENADFEISPFGERPHDQPNILFCSFTLKSSKSFFAIFDDNQERPEIVISGQTKAIQFGQEMAQFWVNILIESACDPEIINTQESGNGTHSYGKVDNTESPITCSASDSLMVIRADGSKEYPDQLICNEDNDWSYKKTSGDQIETVIISVNGVREIIQFYCVTKVCSLCERLEEVNCWMYSKKITDATNITCSEITGKYSDNSKNILPDGSEIFCEPIIIPPKTTTAPVEVAPLSAVVIAGIVIAVIVIVVAIGCTLFYWHIKWRFRRQYEANEEMKRKLEKEEEEAEKSRAQTELEKRMTLDQRMDYEELHFHDFFSHSILFLSSTVWSIRLYEVASLHGYHVEMILRLLLIVSLTSIGTSVKVEIDLARCKYETICFIRKSFLVKESISAEEAEAATTAFVRYMDDKLNDTTCDVILQSRAFSSEKIHIMIQANSTGSEVPVTDITLQQNGVQFRCSNGGTTTENTEFQISSFGDRPTVQPNILFCSFTIQSTREIVSMFTNNQEKVEIVVDNTESPIACTSLENLIVVRADGREEYSDKIICDYSKKMWSFDRTIGDKIETVIIDYINNVQEIIQVYCVTKVCSLCERLEEVNCARCTPVHFKNDIGQCATSKCDNGLWRISEGGGDPVEGEMKCDHKMGSQNQKESVWYFTPKGKDPVETSKAACARDAVCLHPNPGDSTTITRTGCPQSFICGSIQPEGEESKKDLYCRSGFQLSPSLSHSHLIIPTTHPLLFPLLLPSFHPLPLIDSGRFVSTRSRLFMILRLLLIFSLSSIECYFKNEIDLERCANLEMACFIRESCLVDKTATLSEIEDAKGSLERYMHEPLNDNTCDVILQARAFSSKKFHIMVQVNSSDPSVPVTDITLQQNGVQFRCRNGRATTENAEFQISPFGEPPQLQPNILFCSFTLQSSQPIVNMFQTNEKRVEIVISGQTETIQGELNADFWDQINAAKTCNPEIITTKNQGNGTHAYGKVDNTVSPITCSALESLIVIRADGSEEFTDQVICHKKNKWSYERKNGDRIEKVIINDVQEIIQVYCVTKVCSLCERLEEVNCAGCTPVNYENKFGQCATSKCDNGLWRISEGGGDPVEGEMKCDHKMGSQNQKESVWYFTPKGKDPVETSKAACAIDAVCLHPNPGDSTTITRTGCPQSFICGSIQPEGEESKKDLYCRSGFQLRYKYEEKITDATNITCSTITGKYSDDSNNILPDGSLIFCEPITSVVSTTTEIVSVAAASSFPTGAVIGGIVGLIIIIAVAGGFAFCYFTIRRKIKEREDNEIAIKDDFVIRAKIANEAANPNPEKEVYRREVPDELKSKWELREYMWPTREHLYITKEEWEEELYCWDNSTFFLVIAHKFLHCNTEGRQDILRYLTAFDEYAIGERKERQKDKKPSAHFGNLKQFMHLWNFCRGKMFDCACCWEYMFRFMRMLYENFVPHDDHREICKVMMKAVVKVARPWLNELTYRQRTWEDATDTQLRPLAIRMLLWAEAPDVIAEMKRMADLPILDLQVSIRPVVLQYAARNLGRAEAMKKQYWGMIEGGTEINILDPHCAGTLRQHLLFAICSARDESKKGTPDEYEILRDMMKIMLNYKKMDYTTTSYTPADQWWAIRGATDSVAGFKPVVDMFIEFAPKNFDEIYEKHVDHTVNFDLEKKKPVKKEWRRNVRRLYNLLAELCTNKSQFDDLVKIVTPMAAFVKQNDKKHTWFYVNELGERALNFGNLFSRKDVADVFYTALIETQQMRNAADHKDGEDVHVNRLRRIGANWSAKHSHHDMDD